MEVERKWKRADYRMPGSGKFVQIELQNAKEMQQVVE